MDERNTSDSYDMSPMHVEALKFAFFIYVWTQIINETFAYNHWLNSNQSMN